MHDSSNMSRYMFTVACWATSAFCFCQQIHLLLHSRQADLQDPVRMIAGYKRVAVGGA